MKKLYALILITLSLTACSSSNDTTEPPVGPAPVVLSTPTDFDISSGSVLLSWTISTLGDFSFYAVVMESASDSVLVAITDRNTTEYQVQHLQPGTTYHFRVDVMTTANVTGKGNSVAVTTKNISETSTSPDALMSNFKNTWEKMWISDYELLLDDQFQFFFDPNDGLEQFVGPSWGRTEELDSAKSIFEGDAGYDLIKKEDIPPVLSIEFTTFSKVTPWTDPGTDSLYEGTLKASYKVGIKVSFQGVEQYTYLTGDYDFYVVKVPQADGPDIYKIKVWEDQGQDLGGKSLKSAAQYMTWGYLKAMF